MENRFMSRSYTPRRSAAALLVTALALFASPALAQCTGSTAVTIGVTVGDGSTGVSSVPFSVYVNGNPYPNGYINIGSSTVTLAQPSPNTTWSYQFTVGG